MLSKNNRPAKISNKKPKAGEQKKVELSVVILTNRSDSRFIRSLKSAQLADEILIIDNLSNNNWTELKKQFRFKVIKRVEKVGDFAYIRNWSLNQVSNNWVMFLDSDEVIDSNSWVTINTLINQSIYRGAMVKRKDYFLGKKLNWGEVGSFNTLRLGQKNFLQFSRPIHETASINGLVKKSSIVIKHYPHSSISSFIDKVTNYAKLESAFRKTQDQKFSLLELLFFPLSKFIYNFIFKLGFLDGFRGLIYATMMSIHSLGVRANQYEQSRNK